MERMTYAGSGVDYGALDPFKRRAQLAGRSTADVIRRLGVSEVEMSRGESAYLIETPESYLAHVEEGLGTKNLVADAMYRLVPARSYYDHIAQDTVAMIVNDMVTLGALPLAVAMHLGVGSSDWFNDERRTGDLVDGWRKACQLARCAWGGGETPTLSGDCRGRHGRPGRLRDRHGQAERPVDSRERPARRCHRAVRELRHTCQRAYACARNCRACAERLPHAASRWAAVRRGAARSHTHLCRCDRGLPEPRHRHSLCRQHDRPWLAKADARAPIRSPMSSSGSRRRSLFSTSSSRSAASMMPRRTATSTWAPDSRSMCRRATSRQCWTSRRRFRSPRSMPGMWKAAPPSASSSRPRASSIRPTR